MHDRPCTTKEEKARLFYDKADYRRFELEMVDELLLAPVRDRPRAAKEEKARLFYTNDGYRRFAVEDWKARAVGMDYDDGR